MTVFVLRAFSAHAGFQQQPNGQRNVNFDMNFQIKSVFLILKNTHGVVRKILTALFVQGKCVRLIFWMSVLMAGSMQAWGAQVPAMSIADLPGVSARVAAWPSALEAHAQEPTGSGSAQALIQATDNAWPEVASQWLHIRLEVPSDLIGRTVFLQVKPAYLLDLRLLQAGQDPQRSGAGMAFSQRSMASILPTFSVTLAQPTTHIHLRLTGVNTHVAQIKLLSYQALAQANHRDAQLHGFFFGAVLLMLVLSLLNLAWTHDSIYRSYAGFLASAVLFFLYTNGYMAAYFLGEHPQWLVFSFKFIAAWVVSSTIFFSLKIMRVRERLPRLELALRCLCWLLLTTSLWVVEPRWIAYFMQTNATIHLLAGVLLLGISAHLAWKLRTKESYLLLGTYLVFTLLDKAPVLSQLNWVPVSEWTLEWRRMGYLFQLLPMHLLLVGNVLKNQRMKSAADVQANAALQIAKSAQFERTELTRFLGLLTHEFRTPLAEIDAAVQSLELQPGAQQPERLSRHARIRHSVKRLNSLVSDALLRERIESSGWQLQLEACTVEDLVATALTNYKLELALPPNTRAHRFEFGVGGDSGGWLELSLPSESPAFIADAHLLQIALGNLLDNAKKYAAVGSTVHLNVVCMPSVFASTSPELRIDVLSFGPVLSSEELARVFEKYWRRDSHAQVGGAGLGLPLVRHIMDLHAGSAEVQQLTGRWLCFSLFLPLVRA